jgi:hypothetical protein
MSQLCELVDTMFECMFGTRSAANKAVKMGAYRERLGARLAQASREREIALRNARDPKLLESERKKCRKQAAKITKLIAAGQKKLTAIEETDFAIEQAKDNAEFVATMRKAGVPKLQKKLESSMDAADDLDGLVTELTEMIGGDVTIDESELDMEIEEDESVETLPLMLPKVPSGLPGRQRSGQTVRFKDPLAA